MKATVFIYITLIALQVADLSSYSYHEYKRPSQNTNTTILKEWTTAQVQEVDDRIFPRSEDFYREIETLEGSVIEARTADQGISHNLLLRKDEQTLGIFRRSDRGGEIEAMLLVLDKEGFFDLAPIVRLTLQLEEGLVEGYLQRFEKGSGVSPKPLLSLLEEIQKVGLLDILIANRDRHQGNVVLRDGILVPIDHNLSLFKGNRKKIPGLNLRKALAEEPFFDPILPGAIHLPFWWSNEKMRRYARRPWTAKIRQWIASWDPKSAAEELQEQFAFSSDTALLLEIMGRWVKQGVEADLTLEQLATPIYHPPNGFYFNPPAQVNTANFDSIWLSVHLDYEVQRAVKSVQQQVEDLTISDAQLKGLFLSSLQKAFAEHILLLKDRLPARKKEAYAIQAWMNYIRAEASQVLFSLDAEEQKSTLTVQKEILDEAQKLAQARYLVTFGSVQNALTNYFDAYWIYYVYAKSLLTAYEEKGQLSSMKQLLWDQIQNPTQLLLEGDLWDSSMHMRMLELSREQLIWAIQQTKERAQLEAKWYVHPDSEAWIPFAAPKFLPQYLEMSKEIN